MWKKLININDEHNIIYSVQPEIPKIDERVCIGTSHTTLMYFLTQKS